MSRHILIYTATVLRGQLSPNRAVAPLAPAVSKAFVPSLLGGGVGRRAAIGASKPYTNWSKVPICQNSLRRQNRSKRSIVAMVSNMSRYLDFAIATESPVEIPGLSGDGLSERLKNLPPDDIDTAKHTLQLCWNELCQLRADESAERPEAGLPIDQAYKHVGRWLRRAEVVKLFENGLSHSTATRQALDLAVAIIAGQEHYGTLVHLLSEITQSLDDEGSEAFKNRRRLRSHIFKGTVNAVSPRDPNTTHEHHHSVFIKSIAMENLKHMDIVPLALHTLKGYGPKSSKTTREFNYILKAVLRKELMVGAELELRMTGFCLYGPGRSSPEEFMELLTAIHDDPYHQLRLEPPPEDVQDRISRMHRLAHRCAHLLGEQGRHEDAEKVLAMVTRVYNDGYLAYQRWNHSRDAEILQPNDVL